MQKIKIGIICGGMSTEHEVSLDSAKSVINNLDQNKYIIYKIIINKNGTWLDENNKKIENIFSYIKELDVVFPVLHGMYGEDRNDTRFI